MIDIWFKFTPWTSWLLLNRFQIYARHDLIPMKMSRLWFDLNCCPSNLCHALWCFNKCMLNYMFNGQISNLYQSIYGMILLFKYSKILIMHDFIQHVSRVRHEIRFYFSWYFYSTSQLVISTKAFQVLYFNSRISNSWDSVQCTILNFTRLYDVIDTHFNLHLYI